MILLLFNLCVQKFSFCLGHVVQVAIPNLFILVGARQHVLQISPYRHDGDTQILQHQQP
jgi:hypothetical protein